MNLNGIYWTAVVFGESQLAVNTALLSDVQPYKTSVLLAVSDLSAMPPRASMMQGWATMSADGSGGGTAVCVLTIQSHISTAPYASSIIGITSTMSPIGLPHRPPTNLYKPTVQRASTW